MQKVIRALVAAASIAAIHTTLRWRRWQSRHVQRKWNGPQDPESAGAPGTARSSRAS